MCVSRLFQKCKRIKKCAETVESAQAIYKVEPQRRKKEHETAETRERM